MFARITYLGKRFALLNDVAAEAKLELAKFRAAIADRQLTIVQQHTIAAALEKYSGQTVWLHSPVGDGEANRLGLQIKRALELAHIPTEDQLERGMTFDTTSIVGIRIECKLRCDLATALLTELSTVGGLVTNPLFDSTSSDDSRTQLFIGTRPATLAK